jgi:hypothetical protein
MLQRETCEILSQSETISNLSFDMGMGFADDVVPECAFAASNLACLRSIESINEGYLSAVIKDIFSYPDGLQGPDIPLPWHQPYSRLIPPFWWMIWGQLSAKKLQGRFFRPRREKRTADIEARLSANNVLNTIYQSGKSKEAGAWLGRSGLGVPDSLSQQTLHPSPSVLRTRDVCLWAGWTWISSWSCKNLSWTAISPSGRTRYLLGIVVGVFTKDSDVVEVLIAVGWSVSILANAVA